MQMMPMSPESNAPNLASPCSLALFLKAPPATKSATVRPMDAMEATIVTSAAVMRVLSGASRSCATTRDGSQARAEHEPSTSRARRE